MRRVCIHEAIVLCVFMFLSDKVEGLSRLNNCETNDTVRVVYQYNSDVVKREYIVRFHGYYSTSTRTNYITSALDNAKVSNWTIVDRDNPAAKEYPSDFDIVIFDDTQQKDGISALLDHPLVKSVTAHRVVKRTVKYVNDNDCGPNGCAYAGWRTTRLTKSENINTRKLLRSVPRQITTVLKAEELWSLGFTGKGIKIAVFDTGLAPNHPHFPNIGSRTDWTGEHRVDDTLGHGTFVAGVIGSQSDCVGFAPGSDLHIFRVFTDNQVSYTSWFLDAFNYAIMKKIDILNLSIGGPDFMDHPFVDKVWELSANNVIMISAIGNDGPQYGTLNNPADQMDVIGVGGIGFDDRIARFSSRGMTTWELPQGYGRMKPDIVTYGSGVKGSSVNGGCRSLSGTSVASPVVAGAVALLGSAVDKKLLTPASVKQALIASAERLPHANMFEQGHGKFDLIGAYEYLKVYTPRATFSPSYLDLTECTYMWPYCTQPLYYSAIPTIVNLTIINGLAVSGQVVDVKWHPHLPDGPLLSVTATYSDVVWPWSGWLALMMSVTKEGATFDGIVEGHVNVTIESLDETGVDSSKNVTIMLPLKAKIIPVPVRERRLLWDQFHSLRYPSGYFPRDDLKAKHDPLDWHADHVHTNFKDLYKRLREQAYFIEVLGTPLTCIDTSLYGAYLLVDPEDEYFPEELDIIRTSVAKGMSLIVFADWYNSTLLSHVKFYDENTRQWWIPETGGANIPALNELLGMYQIALGDRVFEGSFKLGGNSMYYASGTHIHTFPEHGVLLSAQLKDQGCQIMSGEASESTTTYTVPVLGLLQTDGETKDYSNDTLEGKPKAGRVVVYGDSSCLENGSTDSCYWLMLAALQYGILAHVPQSLTTFASPHRDVHIIPSDLPKRPEGTRIHLHSRVLSPDGSGTRVIPDCVQLSPLRPHAVHSGSKLPPKPVVRTSQGEMSSDTIDFGGADRTWRGASPGGKESEFAITHATGIQAYMIVIFIASLYLVASIWKRCGRRMRPRAIMS